MIILHWSSRSIHNAGSAQSCIAKSTQLFPSHFDSCTAELLLMKLYLFLLSFCTFKLIASCIVFVLLGFASSFVSFLVLFAILQLFYHQLSIVLQLFFYCPLPLIVFFNFFYTLLSPSSSSPYISASLPNFGPKSFR